MFAGGSWAGFCRDLKKVCEFRVVLLWCPNCIVFSSENPLYKLEESRVYTN